MKWEGNRELDNVEGRRAGGGAVVPDSFTHGSSAQRQPLVRYRTEKWQRQAL